ncbi:MAG: hypothetical protein ABIG66_01625 [Candidatus Kerfeldbacteria bacterium]
MRRTVLIAAFLFILLPLATAAKEKTSRQTIADYVVACTFSEEEAVAGMPQEISCAVTDLATKESVAGATGSILIKTSSADKLDIETITSNEDGEINLTFRVDEAGEHEMHLTFTDKNGNPDTDIYTFAAIGESSFGQQDIADFTGTVEIVTLILLSIATILFLFVLFYMFGRRR